MSRNEFSLYLSGSRFAAVLIGLIPMCAHVEDVYGRALLPNRVVFLVASIATDCFLEMYTTSENKQLLVLLSVREKVPSLKNVNNSLWCYCRSPRSMISFTPRFSVI